MSQYQTSDRGASDVISYILIFSVIITSVGLAYAYVEPEITERASYERDVGVQKMLSLYHEDILAIHEGSSLTQQTAIDSTDSTLSGGDRSTFRVVTPANTYEFGSDKVLYETPSSNFTYEFGSIIQDSEQFNTTNMVLSEELLYKNNDQLFMSIYGVDAAGRSVTGSSRQIDSRKIDSEVYEESGISGDVKIQVLTPYNQLWIDKFSEYSYLTCTDEGTYIECTTDDITNVQIKHTTIQSDFR